MKELDVSDIEMNLLIEAIYQRFQYDFRLYSRSSLKRRVGQALIQFRCQNITQLQEKLLHDTDFFPKLLSYLTVNTTELFRDPEYYRSLRERVFPFLQTYPSIKIWIAGCSTGEEVISMSIILREMGITKYMIYATDINPMNLVRAQKAIYSNDVMKTATRNYQLSGGTGSLSDYYQSAYDSVQFDKTLLEKVVFSDHSLATDEVFSEVHFVSCRNVLIYFERPLQDKVLKLFSKSLSRNGFLGLGTKETIHFSSIAEDFKNLDVEQRIFQKVEDLNLRVRDCTRGEII